MTMNREEAERRARQQEHWRAAVLNAMETWTIPQEEAEEVVTELYWEASDAAALSFAKAQMPTWQLAIENGAKMTADAISFGILSPITIDRIRDALATYDQTRPAGKVGPNERT
jgi:hypothetical protein